jgi:hypothetical protein
MNEETQEQMMQRAWEEGAEAINRIETFDGTRPKNPYEPVKKYPPSVLYVSTKYASAAVLEGKTFEEGSLEFYDFLADVQQEAYDAGRAVRPVRPVTIVCD